MIRGSRTLKLGSGDLAGTMPRGRGVYTGGVDARRHGRTVLHRCRTAAHLNSVGHQQATA